MRTSIETLVLYALVFSAVATAESPPQQPLVHTDNGGSTDGLPFSISALEDYIHEAMERWHAPGMAVAIINGNDTWAKVSLPVPPARRTSLFHSVHANRIS